MSLHNLMRAQDAGMRFPRENHSEQTLFDAKQLRFFQQPDAAGGHG